MSFRLPSFAPKPPRHSTIKIALIGLPGAGKTSYLAALLHGAAFARQTRQDVQWVPDPGDRATSLYLQRAWQSIESGEAVRGTLPSSDAPLINLTLQRRVIEQGLERLTHKVELKVLDSAGAFTQDSISRSGTVWADVAGRISQAQVVLVAVDAMNVFHNSDLPGQREMARLFDLLQDACESFPEGSVPIDKKSLALCYCKCDAQTLVDIDGIDDDLDARRLASKLLPQKQRDDLERRFLHVGHFGVSILGTDWRWSRFGACVKVGDNAVEPIGVFEPFEWMTSLDVGGAT